MKLLKKQFIVLSLILSILSCVFLPCFTVSAAPAASTIAQIASYVASAMGLVNIGTNGSVQKVSGSVMDSIKDWVSDYFGSGIYVDSNGNYQFSGTATDALLSSLTANSAYDAKVCSNFGGSFPTTGLYFANLSYCSPEMKSAIESKNLDSGDTLIYCYTSFNGNTFCTHACVVDVSNVAFYTYSYTSGGYFGYLNFYNSSGSSVGCPIYFYSQTYRSSSGFSSISSNDSYGNNYIEVLDDGTTLTLNRFLDIAPFNSFTDSSYTRDVNSFFNGFPFIANNGKCLLWSNRSIILAKTVLDGLGQYSDNSGLQILNYYINPVSEEVINNNDWSSIYNSYVTNVSNSYDSDTMDIEQLRQIMKTYTDNIINAVNSGLSDIQDMVSYTNEWLSKIYDLLGNIRDKLNTIDGGGSSGSVIDYTSALTRIENYLSQIVDDTSALGDMAVYLSDLLENSDDMISYLRQIADNTSGGGGGNGIPDVWKTLPDMPDQDILDTISDLELLQLALQNVVPFCFISVIGEFFAIFAVTPQAPRFEIPIVLHNNLVDIDESIIIDLSFSDPIQPIIIVFWYAVFVVCLAYLTFKLFWFWNVFFYE